MKRILIIDDDESAIDLLRQILEQAGYEVVAAKNGQEGLKLFRQQKFDLVVTDMVMPVKDGLKTILSLRQEDPTIPLIAISGGGAIAKERYLNVAGYIEGVSTFPKPYSRTELLAGVNKLLMAPPVDPPPTD